MDSSLLSGLLIILGLVLAKILITAGYSALINASKTTLRERSEEGDRRARNTFKFTEDSKPLLALYQYLSLLLTSGIVATAAVTAYTPLEEQLTANNLMPLLIILLVMPLVSALQFVFTEYVPMGAVMGRAEGLAVIATPPMRFLSRIFTPFVQLNLVIAHRIARLLGGQGTTQMVTEEEIKTLVDAGSEEGILENEEKEMIYSIIRFGDTVAREVMLPRIDIVALDISASLDDALSTIIAKGHSRIPIYRDSIDNIEGVLYAKDLLEVWRSGEKPESLEKLLREPHFVPETKQASELLIELQQGKIHMVFVVDEYGGTAGLVTLEDLVEEIIGEIQDEYDLEEEAISQQIDEITYIFSARVDLDDLNHQLSVNIPTNESDTLGGYIFSELGRVPFVGDEFQDHGLKITVMSVTGRRIRKVKVQKLPESATGEIPIVEAESEDLKSDKDADNKASANPTGELIYGEQN